MKVELTKDWCTNMAKLEDDAAERERCLDICEQHYSIEYDMRSELYTNDVDLIESMVDALRNAQENP